MTITAARVSRAQPLGPGDRHLRAARPRDPRAHVRRDTSCRGRQRRAVGTSPKRGGGRAGLDGEAHVRWSRVPHRRNLAVSASSKGGLLVRVDPVETESLVSEPLVEPFQMRGRAMSGWLRVTSDAVETDDDLERWVRRGVAYARSLGPK